MGSTPMQDSHKNRNRLIAFLMANGGRVTSGNDNVYAFIGHKLHSGGSTFNGMDGLRLMVDAMAQAGVLELERRADGKVTAIKLLTDTSLIALSQDDQLLLEAVDGPWELTRQLFVILSRKQAELDSTNQAFDELSSEAPDSFALQALQSSYAELERRYAEQAQAHVLEIQRLKEAGARQLTSQIESGRRDLERVRSDHDAETGALERKLAEKQARLDLLEPLADFIPPELLGHMRVHVVKF